MPIYEYRCDGCGHTLEVIQKLNDPRLKVCPACEKPSLQKQVSASGFQLKGSGWYATDFKGGAKKATTEAASDTPAKAASSTGGCGGGTCGCH